MKYPPEETEPWDFVPAKKRRPRKPTLASALRQASKAGVTVAAATLKPDGSVALEFGTPSAGADFNEWDTVVQ